MNARAHTPPLADSSVAPLANVNGKIMALSEANVPVLDRGFLFGDAVYEVLRVYAGRPWLETEHFTRLRHSLGEIRINGIDLNRLRRRMVETIAAGPFREATVYIQVTRGAAPRTHAFPSDPSPFELLFVQPYLDPYVDARRVGCGVVTHADLRWGRCDIKSTNLLGNVLAIQAAKEAGCLEAVLYRPDGTLTEGTHSSLFGVVDETVRTSPKTNAVLPGVTRDVVVRLAREAGFRVEERPLTIAELPRTTEAFLTGTTTEVLPISMVDGRPIGDAGPGPVTRRLQKAYEQSVQEFLARSV
jgi:D-alanine transaminase